MANSMLASESLNENTITRTQTGRPTCIIVLGMARSGKSTFVRSLVSKFYQTGLPYVINLDPACEEVSYPPNIDIRDTINYKDVMTRYGLSYKDSIITTLNLFSTQFEEVLETIENDGEEHEYIVIDAPGQTEIFSWFASGNIITRALASRFPTVAVYMMDTVINVDPVIFMSNIMNACYIMHKVRIPFIMVMNKIDIIDHSYAMEWLRDVETFQGTLDSEVYYYGNNPMKSLSLPLDEFFDNLQSCGVSARSGEGLPGFFENLRNAVEGYNLVHQINQDVHRAGSAFGHDEGNSQLNEPSEDREIQTKTAIVMTPVPNGGL